MFFLKGRGAIQAFLPVALEAWYCSSPKTEALTAAKRKEALVTSSFMVPSSDALCY